jgi:hypothetical protein
MTVILTLAAAILITSVSHDVYRQWHIHRAIQRRLAVRP